MRPPAPARRQVEVDRGGDDEVVSTAAHALKRVCSDRRGANVVLVLGDDTDVCLSRIISCNISIAFAPHYTMPIKIWTPA